MVLRAKCYMLKMLYLFITVSTCYISWLAVNTNWYNVIHFQITGHKMYKLIMYTTSLTTNPASAAVSSLPVTPQHPCLNIFAESVEVGAWKIIWCSAAVMINVHSPIHAYIHTGLAVATLQPFHQEQQPFSHSRTIGPSIGRNMGLVSCSRTLS